MTTDTQHDARILDQFTRQADPFADNPAHAQRRSLALILAASGVQAGDQVLDVACGPGLLTTALARVAGRVVGVDFVPAMLARAEREAEKRGLTNVTFQQGDARSLAFDDQQFDRVVTRFSFHHLTDPARTLAEMVRVCRKGGTVTVIDATPSAETRAAYDAMELLRDPSHVRALTPAEMATLFDRLADVRSERFELEMALEEQLAASFPNPGDADRIRALFADDIRTGRNTLGVAAAERGGRTVFSYPCMIFAGVVR